MIDEHTINTNTILMYENLFQKMELGVVYHNSDGKMTETNPATEKILGVTASEMNIMDSYSPEWQAIKKDGTVFLKNEHPAIIALSTGKKIRDMVMGIFHPVKEQQVWITIDAVPEFKESEKQPFRVFTTFKNITSDFETKKELEKRTLEISYGCRRTWLLGLEPGYR